jgi:hypothetical protein
VVPLLESVGAHGVIEASGGRSVRRVHVLWDRGPQVREDPLDHGPLQDRRDDLQLPTKLPAVHDGNWPGL